MLRTKGNEKSFNPTYLYKSRCILEDALKNLFISLICLPAGRQNKWIFLYMTIETWKDIDWYNWIYEISSTWSIRSNKKIEWFIMKNFLNHCWYLYTSLFLDWKTKHFKIHRLVAQAFIPNIDNKPQVNHIDWNKLNNNVENLEWCSISENVRHAFKLWLKENNYFIKWNPSKWKFWKEHFNHKEYMKTW